MTWYPSISAARRLITRLWPAIKQQVPEARLRIVGWSARSALKEYLDTPGIEILENVPDIQPYFQQASVFLYAPARGSGMKIKILECMLFGVPIVTTSEGVEGIPAKDGAEASVCEDDAGLISRTVELLRDPERRERQRRAARALVESHCGPGPTVTAIEEMYQGMVRR
jgi:glycosyltransferase involved in cell wall biosynthesis